jgi:hypothetical protein
MTYVHPAWLAHQRKRFTRADAYRLAPPGTPEAKPPGWLDPSATRVRLKEAQEEEARSRAAAEQEEFEREVLALRHDFAKLKLEYELRRFQQKYSPDQPRAPKGDPDGGQWVRDAGKDGNEASAISPSPLTDIGAARRRSGVSEAECAFQYKQDTFICNSVRTLLCWQQAAARYGACLAGQPLPPLNF